MMNLTHSSSSGISGLPTGVARNLSGVCTIWNSASGRWPRGEDLLFLSLFGSTRVVRSESFCVSVGLARRFLLSLNGCLFVDIVGMLMCDGFIAKVLVDEGKSIKKKARFASSGPCFGGRAEANKDAVTRDK